MDAIPGEMILISQLNPNDGPVRGTIRGVVTIIWPYSASKQSFSLLLAERDFRLRRKKGQVRVTFRGHSAIATNLARIGSGNELTLSLDGAIFQPELSQEQTPGRGIEWKLDYSRRVHVAIQREDGQTTTVKIDRTTPTPEPEGNLPTTAEETFGSPPSATSRVNKVDQVWESPAFLSRRTNLAQSNLSQFPSDDEETLDDTKRSKRTKFGRQSGQWRFADRDMSPTPVTSSTKDIHATDLPSSDSLFESDFPKISPVSATKSAGADGYTFADPSLDASFHNEATDHFQLLEDTKIASTDEFASMPDSGLLQSHPSQGASFAVTGTADTNVGAHAQDNLDAEAADNLIDVTAPTIASDFLISPDFQTFPLETTPVYNETGPAVVRPVLGDDVVNEESSRTLFDSANLVPLPSETPALEYGTVVRPGVRQTQVAITAQSDRLEVKSGSAKQPIEIIDLDSDSSSIEGSSHANPIVAKEEENSENEFASEDDDQEERLSPSDEDSGAESARMRRRSSSGIYESEESEELSETADERYQMSRQLKDNSIRTEQSSTKGSEEEDDAEGDDDYDHIQSTRRVSVSSSSEDTAASVSTTDPTERRRRPSLQGRDGPVEDSHRSGFAKHHNAANVNAVNVAESTTHQSVPDQDHEERPAEDEAIPETFGVAEKDQTLFPLAMQPSDDTAEAQTTAAISSKARLVTRGRLATQEEVDDGTVLPSIGFNQQDGSTSMDDTRRLPDSQGRSSKYLNSTKPTIAASNVAKRVKEEFHPSQNPIIGGFRTPLAYFMTIASLTQYYNRQVDIIGVVVLHTEIQQAKKGPKDHFTTLQIADPWAEDIGRPEYVSAQMLRQRKTALPECQSGDVILLRQFKVQQHKGKLQLLSSSDSAWAVFDRDGKITVHGPPVELGTEEKQLAEGLQQWWAALEHELIATEELAAPKTPPKESQMKHEVVGSMPPASPERHVLRDGSSYTDGPGKAVHQLRDGSTYSD